MARYYDQRVKLRRFSIRDLVYGKLNLQQRIQPMESWGQLEKAPKKSPTTLDKEATPWNPWMVANYLIHGMSNPLRGH